MFAKAVAAVLLTTLVAPAPGYAARPRVSAPGAVTAVPGHPEAVPAIVLMSQIVTRTNQVRHLLGREPLAVDHGLVDASLRQSYDMAATGRFSHIGRDGSTFVARAHAAGYERPSGENIGWGFETAEDVVRAWMASPRHRANMLDRGARSIGTGVVYATDGTAYFTEVFGWG